MRFAMVLGVTLVSLGASASERWTAPYQLQDQRGRTFRVVLGAKAPEGVESKLGVMTVLGRKGTAAARLKRVEPVCKGPDDPKSGTRPVCHTVGVYTQEPGTAALGEGLAALPGRVEGQLGTPAPKEPEEKPSVSRWASKEYQAPVDEKTGAPQDTPPAAYRWAASSEGGAVLERRDLGPDFYAPRIHLEACAQERQAPFTRLTCQGASLLYADHALLAASFDDYGEARTELVATLRTGGEELHLVRVGLKGQAIIGLLFRDGGRWRLLLRPADYPVLD